MNAVPVWNRADGRRRAVIENVSPRVDGGRFPVKRCVDDVLAIEADVFIDGHDVPRCVLRHRRRGEERWNETEMQALGNDRWRAQFRLPDIGVYEYAIAAWADAFVTWRKDVERWTERADIELALRAGAALVAQAAARAQGNDARLLGAWSENLAAAVPPEERRALALDEALAALARRYPDRSLETVCEPLAVVVDPPLARFSTWYEMFPRSAGSRGRHGSFADCEARLAYVAQMGFDVLYLPPIHPIGTTKRKGRNNSVHCSPGDPGSPWAIGAGDGGHKAINSQLGTAEEFRALVKAARLRGIEIALDIAFQCSPDHPYVREHPEWFRHRPDGTVQFAENPPKKYEDIYPFNFETEDWRALWEEMKDVFLHWIGEGVRIFRVDNPHTKPFAMWEWLIADVKTLHPDVLFLSEAFTRPKIMHRLAKLGFSQSYTYFTWRNTKAELVEYFTELAHSPSREYFRPNVWPNTPDILHEYLQRGGRPAFAVRLILAATLAASYGIYGPAFELAEHTAREPGSEEYRDSEKYELRSWDIESARSLRPLIARMNAIRRANRALQQDARLAFYPTDNDQILCYAKSTEDRSNVILTVVNIDPRYPQSGWVNLDLHGLGLPHDQPYEVHDLLSDARFRWQGARNYVALAPGDMPAHVLRLPAPPGATA
jgi:starch synthase (maltosyl-transferring)